VTDSLNRKRQISDSFQREAEQIMKRCQRGTRNYEEANNLHAACYGIIGKLLAQTEQDHIPDARKMVTEQEPVVGITAIRTWFKDGRVVTQTLCNSWVDTTAKVRADEREACAKVVDDIESRCIAEDVDDPPLKHVASAIRARGEQT
jgi:hypothetical protein